MSSEVCLFVLQAEFPSDILPVRIYRFLCQIHNFGYILCCFTFFYKICNPDLCGGKFQILGGQSV